MAQSIAQAGTPERIALTPTQEWYLKCLAPRIERLRFLIDNSETGSGKTYTTSALAGKLPVDSWAVFCHIDMLERWKKIGAALSHKPLRVEKYKHIFDFEAVGGRIFLVIDELQMLGPNEALMELAHRVLDQDGYVMVTSANPFKSLDFFYIFFQRLGLIEGGAESKIRTLTAAHEPFLRSLRDRYAYLIEGLKPRELAEYNIKPLKLDDCEIRWNATREERLSIMYRASTRLYMFCNPRVLDEGLRFVTVNLVYRLTREQREVFEPLLLQYKISSSLVKEHYIKAIHKLQFPFLADIVFRILGLVPRSKVIVFMDAADQAAILLELLGTFGIAALKVTGDSCPRDRETGRRLFNQPNLLYRVIILSPKNGCSGVSLHDEDGRFPRYLVSLLFDKPDQMAQLVGRHIRVGMRSKEVGTYIVSSDAMVDDAEEREIFYGKSTANRELINDSLISMEPPEAYEVVYTDPDPELQAAERIQCLAAGFEDVDADSP